jgi:hypothetical protein
MSALRALPAEQADRSRLAARVGLAVVAAGNAEVGIWGTAAPRSFYNSYPGFGHHWVAALGPYNEHLVRDYAAAELGFAVLLAIAAWWFSRQIVLAASAAFLAATVPHFAYHLTTTGKFGAVDNAGSLGAFMLEMAVVAAALLVVNQTHTRSPDGTS